MHQGDPLFPRRKPLGRCLQRHLIPVYTDQAACGKPPDNLRRMSRTAQGTVQIDPVRFDIQPLNALIQQD